MKREQILNKAKVLISGERAIDYGDAYVNHKRIAELWTTILGKVKHGCSRQKIFHYI